MYTSVRSVYMDVIKLILTALHFLNRKGNIFYRGNTNIICFFLCKLEGLRISSQLYRMAQKQPAKRQQDEERKQVEEKHDQDEDRNGSRLLLAVWIVRRLGSRMCYSEGDRRDDPEGQREQERRTSEWKSATVFRLTEVRDLLKKEERRKLLARDKASRNQSPPGKK